MDALPDEVLYTYANSVWVSHIFDAAYCCLIWVHIEKILLLARSCVAAYLFQQFDVRYLFKCLTEPIKTANLNLTSLLRIVMIV